jgi:hypothetical protein
MTEPSTKDEIPNLCKETFLPWKKAMVILYVLAGVAISAASAGISWAMITNTELSKVTEKVIVINQRLDKLDRDINTKLDTLIARK